MRYIYQGVFRDGNGKIVDSGTVSVYLAGTTTAASVYAASSGGTAVNSVLSGSDGSFSFFVDDADYSDSQAFKIALSKTDFTSKSYDNIIIFPQRGIPSFGELYEDSASGTALAMAAAATDYQWVSSTAGLSSGGDTITVSASTDSITVGAAGAGTYRVSFSISVKFDKACVPMIRVFKNASELDNVEADFQIVASTTSVIFNASAQGYVTLAAGDVLKLYLQQSGNTNVTATIYHVTMGAERIDL